MPTKRRAPSEGRAPDKLAASQDELTAAHVGLIASQDGLTKAQDELSGIRNGPDASRRGDLGAARSSLGRERVVDIQRARMLAAMFDVVAERGAANASVAHVVSRSGVSRRTFYELFEDRETCFLAAFDDAVACGSERVLEAYGSSTRWRERIRVSLAALLQFLDDQPAMGRLLVVEVLGAGPRALERRAHVLAQIVKAINQGCEEAKADPLSLTAEGVVGAVFSVIHTRMLDNQSRPLLELTGPLMSMIVLPYLGVAAAQKELERPLPERNVATRRAVEDPLRDLQMRLTYRTVRVLMAIAAHPQASNRQIANAADVSDQGQMSKLLARLEHLGLIENTGTGSARGEPNAWTLTATGRRIEQTIQQQTQRPKN